MKTLTKHVTLSRSAIVAVVLAAVLVLTATVDTTLSYFTTYATAKGTVPVSLKEHTDIIENAYDEFKEVVISNSEDSRAVFVRAKAFSGSGYPLSYEGTGWKFNQADGYYYYDAVLEPGHDTEMLKVTISGIPVDAKDDDSFNVVVVYETTPALYKFENGVNVPYADWSSKGGEQ